MIDTIQTAGPYVLVWCGFWIRRLRIFRREPDTWKAGDYEHDLWRDVREPAGMAIRCPPGIRCHGSVVQGILPQAREKLESDYRIELEERVVGSRERPRAIRAHEWTQGDVKQNMRQIEGMKSLSNKRLHRSGQEHTVIIHHIIAEGTLDEDIMKALEDKRVYRNMEAGYELLLQ